MKEHKQTLSTSEYTNDFFQAISEGSLSSAKAILPIIFDLIQPKSVVDVGCGNGLWLSVCQALGAETILGIDGDYVQRDELKVPESCFQAKDLTQPLRLEQTFDLVISVEVAEHLPDKNSDVFVESLISLGKVVLFSAAVPFQGGVEHINEQWPNYWKKKFEDRGYICLDCIRPQVWDNPQVDYWYAQNIFVFIEKNILKTHVELNFECSEKIAFEGPIVHPRNYLGKNQELQKMCEAIDWYKYRSDPRNWPLGDVLRVLPIIFWQRVKRIIKI